MRLRRYDTARLRPLEASAFAVTASVLPLPSLLSHVVILFYDMPQLSSNRPDEETVRNGTPMLYLFNHVGDVDQTPSHLHILRYQLSTKSVAYTWLTICLQESTFCDHALLTVFGLWEPTLERRH